MECLVSLLKGERILAKRKSTSRGLYGAGLGNYEKSKHLLALKDKGIGEVSCLRKKISIFGAGRVGSTTAFLCAQKELGDVMLWNRTADLAKGLALDIAESLPMYGSDVRVAGTGDYKDTKDSDVVVITAGAQRKPGQSRDELVQQNAQIVGPIAKEAAKHSPKAVFIIVSNPLDAMVYLAKQATRLPKEKVVGMAGILDSSRFRSFIAMETGYSVDEVSALILGGHGDFMLPLPSHASVAGIPLTEVLSKKRIYELAERARNGGAEILQLEKESSAFYAPGASVARMVQSLVHDKKDVVPCAAYLEGEYGISGVYMGVPVVLGENGVERILEVKLSFFEKLKLKKSAKEVASIIRQLPQM